MTVRVGVRARLILRRVVRARAMVNGGKGGSVEVREKEGGVKALARAVVG